MCQDRDKDNVRMEAISFAIAKRNCHSLLYLATYLIQVSSMSTDAVDVCSSCTKRLCIVLFVRVVDFVV